MSDKEPIRLVFDPHVRVAGEVIAGEVLLNYPLLQKEKVEDVYIKLRGAATSEINRRQRDNRFGSTTVGFTTFGNDNAFSNTNAFGNNNGFNSNNDRLVSNRQTEDLVHETVSVWQQGRGLYPPPGTHIIRLPFQFTLQDRLPPSFSHHEYSRKCDIGYYVEVVGQRPGLRFNKRELVPFPVLPASQRGAEAKLALTSGWRGPWRTFETEDKIRRGIWGEYSHVKAVLTIPDMEELPLWTPIPFTLNVITETKTIKFDDYHHGDEIFPAPPLKPEDIDFTLDRVVNITAREWADTTADTTVCMLGGFGKGAPNRQVQVQVMDKIWTPLHVEEKEKKHGKGSWRQEVGFRSSMELSCPPTFQSHLVNLSYWLQLKVDFAGIGNDLKIRVPVTVSSSMFPPRMHPPPSDGQRPHLDLPPAYFQSSTWDSDEKK